MKRDTARRSFQVTGFVQGVGFRPFVHALASKAGLSGFVRNELGAVRIEVEGPVHALDGFADELGARPPPRARIDGVIVEQLPVSGAVGFTITPSDSHGPSAICVPPDLAPCDACLAELFDPHDRRCGYPFLNCLDCGPRLTVIRTMPSDRASTTLAGFALIGPCG